MPVSEKPGEHPEAVAAARPNETGQPAAGAAPLEDLETLLLEKTREAQENFDRLLRLGAEMENLKKRQERERTELVQFANENLIKALLPILDNLERALENGRQFDAPEALLAGLELVHQDFLKALGRFGVTALESTGQPFNPAYHHAVMEEDAPEVEDFTVLKELQRGYLLHHRLLRPAMVVVARNTQKPSTKIDLTV